MVAARSSARLARLAGHVVVATSAAAAPWTNVDRSPPADASIDTDPSIWSSAELMRRATALGASDAQVDSALGASDTPAALVALVRELGPPSPLGVTLADLTVRPSPTVVAEMLERLEHFGIVVVSGLIPVDELTVIDDQLTACGAFGSRGDDGKLLPTGGRMGQDVLCKAPAVHQLLSHPTVLEAAKGLLCRSSRTVALKLLEVFRIPPADENGRPRGREQLLHREDLFWPYHHQPHHWCLDMLWSIDDFDEENGSTWLVPYSHAWRRTAEPERPDLAIQACMPKGSVVLFTGGTLHGGGLNLSRTRGRKCVLSGYTMSWLRSEHRFWAYKPLREAIDTFTPTMQELLGYGERAGGVFGPVTGPPEDRQEWDRSIFNAHYLMRTPEQVAADKAESKTHQDVGNLGYDEPLYAGSFWAPPVEDPDDTLEHGDYIRRLRRRREKWTMST